MKNIRIFYLKNCHFLMVKFSVYLNRRVFVMNVSSGICRQWTESLDTTKHMNGEQRPGWYFAHVQDDLNLLILCMFEGTFLLDKAHLRPVRPSLPHIYMPKIILMFCWVKISADDKLMVFFLFFPRKKGYDYSIGDNLDEISDPISWEKISKYRQYVIWWINPESGLKLI